MNKQMIYRNNGVMIISDESGNKRTEEYYDNLERVLINENVIEEITNKINTLKKELEESSKDYTPQLVVAEAASILVGPSLVFYGVTGRNPFIEKLGNVNFALGVTCLIAPIYGGICALQYKQYLDRKNEERGKKAALEFLQEKRDEVIRETKYLKEDKTKKRQYEPCYAHFIDDSRQIAKLRDETNFYKNIGYNGKRLYKSYLKGTLRDTIKDEYPVNQQDKAIEFVETKVPRLIKKRTQF